MINLLYSIKTLNFMWRTFSNLVHSIIVLTYIASSTLLQGLIFHRMYLTVHKNASKRDVYLLVMYVTYYSIILAAAHRSFRERVSPAPRVLVSPLWGCWQHRELSRVRCGDSALLVTLSRQVSSRHFGQSHARWGLD